MASLESGDIPGAKGYDPNDLGNPPLGLMQVKGYNSTRLSQMYGGLTNPLGNMIAAIQHIQSAWPGMTPQQIIAYNMQHYGYYKGYAEGGLLTEPVAGMGLSTGTPYMFGEAGPEMFAPAGRSGGLGTTVNITVQGATPQDRAFARAIAQEVKSIIVGDLKMRVGFDMGPG